MKGPEPADDIVVRNFRPGDYDRIIEIWVEGKLPVKPRGRDSRRNIERQVGLPNVVFLVAESGGRIVGTVLATHDGRKGWINRLAVETSSRRRGVGRRLVIEAERRLLDMGMEIFACLIEQTNTASMKVFGGLGYEKHPEIFYFVKRMSPDI
jgi:ribosomal protein S18 acetylase RimI-like enzyme